MADVTERVAEALADPKYEHLVDLVAWRDHDGTVLVANAHGLARLAPQGPSEVIHGRDPVGDQDPLKFLPYEQELADPSPPNHRNAYPYAETRLQSVFADPTRSPDLVVVHTPSHYFPEHGGHRGEHGSLDVIQSRAPLIISGAGVRDRGLHDDHARLVDVGPTLAWLAGVDPDTDDGRHVDGFGAPLDGRRLDRLVAREARFVIGVLWDGAPSGDLLALAQQGELPGVARLLERGCALSGGAIAEFPSVTLTNHTSVLTGVGPGRHGVLGNVFFDREHAETIVANDALTWHRTSEWLRPGVRTVFEQVARVRPQAVTASVNEPVDRGATYSTMALIRNSGSTDGANGLTNLLPDPTSSPYLSSRDHLADDYYAWCTQVDDAGLMQVLQLWEAPSSAPALTWWNNSVTDAGHHAGGPRSQIARDALCDADRRLQHFLDHLDQQGVGDEVVIVLTADHGFEASNPSCRGHWSPALEDSGVAFRDEGPGFVYLTGE